MKRKITIFLILAMVLSLFPASAFAATELKVKDATATIEPKSYQVTSGSLSFTVDGEAKAGDYVTVEAEWVVFNNNSKVYLADGTEVGTIVQKSSAIGYGPTSIDYTSEEAKEAARTKEGSNTETRVYQIIFNEKIEDREDPKVKIDWVKTQASTYPYHDPTGQNKPLTFKHSVKVNGNTVAEATSELPSGALSEYDWGFTNSFSTVRYQNGMFGAPENCEEGSAGSVNLGFGFGQGTEGKEKIKAGDIFQVTIDEDAPFHIVLHDGREVGGEYTYGGANLFYGIDRVVNENTGHVKYPDKDWTLKILSATAKELKVEVVKAGSVGGSAQRMVNLGYLCFENADPNYIDIENMQITIPATSKLMRGTEVLKEAHFNSKQPFSTTEAIGEGTFTVKDFNVTTSASGGTIDKGAVVKKGNDITINYAPNEGNVLKSVTVDGKAVDITKYPSSYTFKAVSANHEISVVYEVQKFNIKTSVTGGTIDNNVTVDWNKNATIKYAPSEGYVLSKVTIDGEQVDITKHPASYTFKAVKENHEISVTYELKKYHLDTGVWNGEITPKSWVRHGENATVEYTPNEGYELDGIWLDSVLLDPQGIESSYTFENMTSDHYINVVYKEKVRTITTSIENGTIDPEQVVKYENDSIINYEPNEGYQIKEILVDGEPVNVDENPFSYMFEKVTENHDIKVICELIPRLDVWKEANAYDINVGDEVTYTVTVSQEIEGAELRGIEIIDTLSDGLTLVEGSIEGPVTVEEETEGGFKVTLESLTDKVVFTYKAIANKEDIQHNSIIYTASNWPGGGNAMATVNAHTPKVELTKEVSSESFEMGDEVVYTITAKQTEEGAVLRNAVIKDTLPEGLEVIAVDITGNDGEYAVNENEVTVTIPNLATQTEVKIMAKLNVFMGDIVNSAEIKGDLIEPVTAEASFKVRQAELSIEKTADVEEAGLNDIIVYSIKAEAKNAKALNPVVTDVLAPNLELIEGSVKVVPSTEGSIVNPKVEVDKNVVTVSADSLEGAALITFEAKVTSIKSDIENSANLAARNGDAVSSEVVKVTAFEPVLKVQKSSDKDSYYVGDAVNYKIVASTDKPAYDVIILDKIPEGLTLDMDSVKVVKSDGTIMEADLVKTEKGYVTVAIGKLNGEVTVTYSVKADKEGSFTNEVKMTASNTDGSASNEKVIKVTKKPVPEKAASSVPKTGDTNNAVPFIAIGAVAILALVCFGVYKFVRKDKNDAEAEDETQEE